MDRQAANKRVIRTYAAAFSAGDLDRVVALFTPDAVVRGVLGWGGIQVAIPVWRELVSGLGMRLEIEDLVAEGDTVAARMTEHGIFRGPFRGQAPTGRAYEVPAMEWFELSEGRIRRRWGARDFAAIARQIGFVPEG